MYKLLIAEDEDHLRGLIVNQIDWHAIGFDVRAARDGKEAFEIAKEFRPDALLTDIRMPLIDGLQLIELIKADNPYIMAVVLSGHDEFTYAQRSLYLGVVEYLLKPIRPSALKDTMEKLRRRLDDEAEQRAEMENIRLQLEESRPLLRQQYLRTILQEYSSDELIKKQFDYLGIDLDGSVFTVAMLSRLTLESPADEFFMRFAIQNLLVKQFSDMRVAFTVDDSGRQIILCAADDDSDMHKSIKSALESCMALIKDQFSIASTGAIGSDVYKLSELGKSYTSALAALDRMVLMGEGRVFDSEDCFISESNPLGSNFHDASALITKLPYENVDTLKAGFDAFFTGFSTRRITDITNIRIILVDLINDCQKLLLEYDPDCTIDGSIYHELFSLGTLPEMKAVVQKYVFDVKSQVDDMHKQIQQDMIHLACDFIAKNYCDAELSLSSTAKSLFVSPSYLSNLFKRRCNMNFVDYVTKMRMDKACELLTASEYKTYEIASLVGYSNAQYFSTCFKKYTGMTPSEWRTEMVEK